MNEKESWKRLEQLEEDVSQIQPELSALRDNLVKYELAQAQEHVGEQTERQARDLLIVTWRDIIHAYLKQVGQGDPILLHKVIDNMDDFLNRAGGRRK